jgi:membrane-bound lytic murein transglycosylase D
MPLRVEKVEVPGGTPLSAVAHAISVDTDDIEELNPELIQSRTPPGKPYPVRIPLGRADAFVANFRKSPAVTETPVKVAVTHRVSSGESLSTIARRHGITVAALQRENGMGARTVIRPGQVLKIPA